MPDAVNTCMLILRTCACTKAVVASCVVLVPAAAIGAAGVPVNVGEAKSAPPAPVTSAPINVTAPVRVLNEVTAAANIGAPVAAMPVITCPAGAAAEVTPPRADAVGVGIWALGMTPVPTTPPLLVSAAPAPAPVTVVVPTVMALGPAGPVGPVAPVAPVVPGGPCDPVAPVAPSVPGVPCGPCGPCAPVAPVVPGLPCGPCAPVAPLVPGGPCGPVGPTGPTILPASTHAVPSQTQTCPVSLAT